MDFMMAEKKLSNDKSLEVNITISRKKRLTSVWNLTYTVLTRKMKTNQKTVTRQCALSCSPKIWSEFSKIYWQNRVISISHSILGITQSSSFYVKTYKVKQIFVVSYYYFEMNLSSPISFSKTFKLHIQASK